MFQSAQLDLLKVCLATPWRVGINLTADGQSNIYSQCSLAVEICFATLVKLSNVLNHTTTNKPGSGHLMSKNVDMFYNQDFFSLNVQLAYTQILQPPEI
jgi:hypothetical protein